MNDFEKPRTHHYYFAHRFLPELLAGNPLKTKTVFEKLSGPTALTYLKFHWTQVGLSVKSGEADRDEFVSADDLAAFTAPISDDCSAVVIRFPTPERMAEAYFAAVFFWPESGRHRYFVLELTGDRQGGNRSTIFGEWSGGSHFNLGRGPAPDRDEFLKAVSRLVSQPPADTQ